MVNEELITDKAFCEWVGISRNTARAWRNAGKLPFIRLPRRGGIRYRARDVSSFLRDCEKAAGGIRYRARDVSSFLRDCEKAARPGISPKV